VTFDNVKPDVKEEIRRAELSEWIRLYGEDVGIRIDEPSLEALELRPPA